MRFAAVGIDHDHIYAHISGLLAEGLEFAGYNPDTTEPAVLNRLRELYPDTPQRAAAELLEDTTIDVVCTAAVPVDRPRVAIAAMHAGKDVIADKPGLITNEQINEVRRTVDETGRKFAICFSERFCVPAAEVAGKLVADGAIGRVVQTLGMGPHRIRRDARPAWFWDISAYGGILADIASHQIDQFLFYTGSSRGEVVASTLGNFANPQAPGFYDFGDVMLRSDRAAGYVRVDWFTPDGLPVWGDGRLTILGTEGYIELRKYIDIEGRPGGNHLFLVNAKGTQYRDCSGEPLSFFTNFVRDVRDRTDTTAPQEHYFEVSRLAIEAQRMATVLGKADQPTGAA